MQLTKQNELIGNWLVNNEDYAIAHTLSDKKIGQFDRVELGEVVDVLAQWRLMLGVTSETTQEELAFITQFIYDEYKHLTMSDLKLAKNWVIKGRVDVGFVTQKTFSAYYITRSLNAYEDEKRRLINEIAHKKERYESRRAMEKPEPISVEDKVESFKEHILIMYRASNEDRAIVDLGDMVYNWLREVKLLQPDSKEVSDAMNYATERLREMKYEENKLNFKIHLDPQSDEIRKKKFAREYVINKLFKRISVSDIISRISIEYFKK